MRKMRAMVVRQPGAGLRLEERHLPEPGRHEVRVKVEACGVCHSDSLTVEGRMPGLAYPRIPGHEVIGRVDAWGEDVKGWPVGARAGVGWFPGACGRCAHCRRRGAFACENIKGATGVKRDGDYATLMLALASALARVPHESSRLHHIASMNEVFPLAEAQAAYERMMSGRARFRVVLKV
jgi:alcohol dehydrogenase